MIPWSTNMLHLTLVTAILWSGCFGQCGAQTLHGDTSFEATKELFGVINKEEVAKDIARALVRGAYGEHEVNRQEPFRAERDGDIWEVTGSAIPIADKPNSDGSVTLTSGSLGPTRITMSAKTGEIFNFVTKRVFPSAWPGLSAGQKEK